MDTRIAIVGGGLGGLYAAYRLGAKGIPFVLVEARERLGGRILSCAPPASAGPGDLDLGPSWFWPDHQPMLDRLIEEVGLARFRQHDSGDALLEQRSGAIRRHGGDPAAPASFRIAGGTGALTAALAAALPPGSVHLGLRVTHAALQGAGVRLEAISVHGDKREISAAQAIVALPPRLADASIGFDPPLPPSTRALWRATPTWMAPHAKFVAVYARAFWREAGLSGHAQSMVGPMVEIHDASTAAGTAALFGFLGVPASERLGIGPALIRACVDQLARLFGPEAAEPAATLFKDWATDDLTATTADLDGPAEHASGGARQWIEGAWAGRVALAGSETATEHPGYLEGALVAACAALSGLHVREVLPFDR